MESLSELATCIERGSLDWEQALRCLRHAFRNTPSPDWWRRVLLLAPCHRLHAQGPTPGAVFTSEMISEATISRIVELLKLTNSETNCWQDWLIFSDVYFFLMKHGCIDFVDFVDKLVSRLRGGDQHILRTNHVTWLLAQIIHVELVMNALNTDPRKRFEFFEMAAKTRGRLILNENDDTTGSGNAVEGQRALANQRGGRVRPGGGRIHMGDKRHGEHEANQNDREASEIDRRFLMDLVETTRKILSFYKEDRGSDPNNPQSILLDFISSCQNLRIWSLNTSTREYLNNEQLQKGKQIDEWWRQISKVGSIGMFWVVSFTMAQPACETVMNWLTSTGTTEMLPGTDPQSNERFMVMQEVSLLPISLLSGFSINLCLKLAYQMEESIFSGQVVPSIAMVETYVRVLLIAPHALFRSLMTYNSVKFSLMKGLLISTVNHVEWNCCVRYLKLLCYYIIVMLAGLSVFQSPLKTPLLLPKRTRSSLHFTAAVLSVFTCPSYKKV
ncbi:hypothetical protein OROMI_034062 [Orobanche minor]